jgi:hypothetical protein
MNNLIIFAINRQSLRDIKIRIINESQYFDVPEGLPVCSIIIIIILSPKRGYPLFKKVTRFCHSSIHRNSPEGGN